MPLHRRDFMKLFGVSVASLYLTRCAPSFVQQPTCYAPTQGPVTPPAMTQAATARARLRLYWLRFPELAEKSRGDTDNKLGQELFAGHNAVLDELIAAGEISTPVAELVKEAYGAAIDHVWRSNGPMTCYEPMLVDYTPSSAGVLVEQVEVLNQIAGQGTIDPGTLAKARAALDHDLAFYALTDEEVKGLYKKVLDDYGPDQGPSFEELPLEVTPEVQEATQFIIDLLTNR